LRVGPADSRRWGGWVVCVCDRKGGGFCVGSSERRCVVVERLGVSVAIKAKRRHWGEEEEELVEGTGSRKKERVVVGRAEAASVFRQELGPRERRGGLGCGRGRGERSAARRVRPIDQQASSPRWGVTAGRPGAADRLRYLMACYRTLSCSSKPPRRQFSACILSVVDRGRRRRRRATYDGRIRPPSQGRSRIETRRAVGRKGCDPISLAGEA
jgi:hypothetical protein